VPAASRARLSVSLAGRKAGPIRKPAHRNAPVSKCRDVRINASDRMLDDSGYATLPARGGERDRRRFRVIGEKATRYCAA
jgi:hypothetical protein